MSEGREEQIRERAHALWIEAGRPEGEHEAHWQQACREIDAVNGDGGAGGDAASDMSFEVGSDETSAEPLGGSAPDATAEDAAELTAAAEPAATAPRRPRGKAAPAAPAGNAAADEAAPAPKRRARVKG